MKFVAWIVAPVLGTAFTGCSHSPPETTEEQLARYSREQIPKSRKLAEAGNAEAQYQMGNFSISGSQELPQNIDEGIRWWRKAADQNYLPAEHDLGEAYHDGKLVPQDLAEGVRLLRKVAEQGEDASGDFTILLDVESARSRLGMAYWYGEGARKDYNEAVKWYRKAAEQGDALSQATLAEAYSEGKGVKKDYVQAHMWANLAVVSYSRNPNAQRENERLRSFLASEMTSKQIEEAEKLAGEWKPSKQDPRRFTAVP